MITFCSSCHHLQKQILVQFDWIHTSKSSSFVVISIVLWKNYSRWLEKNIINFFILFIYLLANTHSPLKASVALYSMYCYVCAVICCIFPFRLENELVVQFPARGSTQVLLCLFPGVLWLWHFLYSVGPHPVSSLHIYPLLCRGHSWRVRLAKQETLTSPGHLVSPLVSRGLWMATVTVHQFFCILHVCTFIKVVLLWKI